MTEGHQSCDDTIKKQFTTGVREPWDEFLRLILYLQYEGLEVMRNFTLLVLGNIVWGEKRIGSHQKAT